MMTRVQQRGLCRVIVVNKIDHDAADCARVLDELRDEFGPTVLPLNLPADGGKAVVDCFGRASGESDLGPVADWHQKVIDQVVEVNETVMDHYLRTEEHTSELQSLMRISYAVYCLKNKIKRIRTTITT